MKLSGIFPPLTTPFTADDAVDVDSLRSNVARYNRTGIAGYVVIGSTGESVLLQRREVELAWSTVAEAVAPGKILIAGTGVDSTAETISRTKAAASLGYQAALVKTPYYYKPQMTNDALAEHYLRVADAAPIPVLVYSVPQFTGVAAEAPLVARLAEHPNIIGIKESSGNVQRVTEIITLAPRDFQTLVGSASTLYASLAVGAVGGILAVACFLPELCVELFEAAQSRESRRATELQHRILSSATTVVARYGVPGVKYALDQMGYTGGPARRPLLPLSAGAKREIDGALASATLNASRA
ncbi:MAG TPA: dihydrodipicolinate synthase family protein [Candidatus Acidoferrales bacterium]